MRRAFLRMRSFCRPRSCREAESLLAPAMMIPCFHPRLSWYNAIDRISSPEELDYGLSRPN